MPSDLADTLDAADLWVVDIPGLRLASEMNVRERWYARDARRKKQQHVVATVLRAKLGGRPLAPPLVITLTRLGPRKWDSDNNVIGFKHVRDAVARWLQMDDGSDALEWRYAQEPGRPFGVRIEIARWRTEAA